MKDADIANFADDNIPFTSANNIDDLIDSLEKASSSLFKWFKDNLFKGNPDKCHLLVRTNEKTKIDIGEFSIENSDCEKLLGIRIDNKLKFDYYVSDMYKNVNRKINALARIAPFININKRCILMKSFFRSQFHYCPIWMCHSRTNNRKVNRLHEICLRIIYNDKQSSFIKLLEKDNSVSTHQRNLQILAIEMFKVSNGLSPVLMNDIFKLRGEQTYNLRKLSQFYRPKVNSVYNGTESVSFLGPIIWDLVPNELKDIGNLAAFKKAIKKWSPEKCPCRLCKVYISNVGII